MSSSRSTSYGSSHAQGKGAAYAARSTSPRSQTSYTSSSNGSSIFAHSAQSSRNHRYGSKPQPVIHNGGGSSNDTNTSSSASNAGYYN